MNHVQKEINFNVDICYSRISVYSKQQNQTSQLFAVCVVTYEHKLIHDVHFCWKTPLIINWWFRIHLTRMISQTPVGLGFSNINLFGFRSWSTNSARLSVRLCSIIKLRKRFVFDIVQLQRKSTSIEGWYSINFDYVQLIVCPILKFSRSLNHEVNQLPLEQTMSFKTFSCIGKTPSESTTMLELYNRTYRVIINSWVEQNRKTNTSCRDIY